MALLVLRQCQRCCWQVLILLCYGWVGHVDVAGTTARCELNATSNETFHLLISWFSFSVNVSFAVSTYSTSNLNSPLQVHWEKNHKNIVQETGFLSHVSTNFGPIWPIRTINYPSMLNKLGITLGARMARIFMDLLREAESADFPNPWISARTILRKITQSNAK